MMLRTTLSRSLARDDLESKKLHSCRALHLVEK